MGSLRALCLLACLAFSLTALRARAEAAPQEAQAQPEPEALFAPSGAAREINRHFYDRLRRQPWRAFGWELLLPGAGSSYAGLRTNAIVSLGVTLLGAGLWTAGAVLERDGLWWAGAATFTAGRAYGLVSAPVGAALLNAAFRRQLHIAYRF